MSRHVTATAGTLDALVRLYNEKVYSVNWEAREDSEGVLRLWNSKLGKYLPKSHIELSRGRFRLIAED